MFWVIIWLNAVKLLVLNRTSSMLMSKHAMSPSLDCWRTTNINSEFMVSTSLVSVSYVRSVSVRRFLVCWNSSPPKIPNFKNSKFPKIQILRECQKSPKSKKDWFQWKLNWKNSPISSRNNTETRCLCTCITASSVLPRPFWNLWVRFHLVSFRTSECSFIWSPCITKMQFHLVLPYTCLAISIRLCKKNWTRKNMRVLSMVAIKHIHIHTLSGDIYKSESLLLQIIMYRDGTIRAVSFRLHRNK